MKYIILFLFIILSGCKSSQKAANDAIDKAWRKDSVATAERIRKDKPCVDKKADTVNNTITQVRNDTTFIETVDTVAVDCPDGTVIKKIFPHTTYYITKTVTNDHTRTITKKVEDETLPTILRGKEEELRPAKNKWESWKTAFFIAAIVGLISILVNVIQFKTKK